ncbi:UBX domain-containing protein 4 [Clupea harengus]|uniref:UBX domain-containing protein 4 n=1 Tax=Clupea harengus TaxID=7950 RepID=A0A6P3VKR8_CLUHA|nr:UBX domain-containing protein 4 [Clupea harengus]
MFWFEGSIPAAIATAKQQNAVFVVVITGDDEPSTQMMSSWEDDQVTETSNNSFVAIKIDAKSETCVQFSQIYPVVCVPSSFFIGVNGIPLEVVAGSVSAEELSKRIDKVKQMHFQQAGQQNDSTAETEMQAEPLSQTSTALEAAAQHTPTPLDPNPPACPMENSEEPAPASTSKESLSRPAEEDGASGPATPGDDRSLSSDDVSLASQPEEGLDVKVDRLNKKLEEKREQKKKGEEENEIKKEMERRQHGKEMLDYKRKQDDDRTKRMLDERNREKAEEKAARDRVKQQIALDRADRAARYSKNQDEVEAVRIAALQARQAEQEAKKESTQRERSAIARIQFRLPDGSSFTNQFPSESRLQEARQFVAQEVGNRYGNFTLATTFPRREFTGEDLEKTFLELELAPSASIVLLPSGRSANAVVQSSGGGMWALLGTILYPLLAVWRFLSGFLFCSPPPASGGGPSQNPPQRNATPSTSSGEPKRETIRKRVLEKRPEDFKKDGKIYRLRTQEDSEDENNTWNGNSTQQM